LRQFTTRLYTWFRGDLVGTDEFGNRYYRGKGAKLQGRERRWVLFRDEVEASRVPPEWHAWLHHTTAQPLTENAAKALPWQKEHQPNLTGTVAAYRPAGHDLRGGQRQRATGDYEAWTPN
jgi:NADH:ubiquinone oxidoreductase subunit